MTAFHSGDLLADYSFARPDPHKVREAGFAGVVRYLSADPAKNLSGPERDALFAAGLALRLVWETTAARATEGAAAGAADAAEANRLADELGAPNDLPIYYAVDEQVAPAAVADYFRAAAAVGGRPVKGYGDAAIVGALAADGYGPGWQTEAWSGDVVSPAAELYQRAAPTHAIDGAAGNYDENVVVAGELAGWASSSATSPAPTPPSDAPPAGASAPASSPPEGLGIMLRTLSLTAPMMRGGDVRSVQGLLNVKGPGLSLAVDGIFGPATKAAVEHWQATRGLLVDGIVGTAQTWPSLIEA